MIDFLMVDSLEDKSSQQFLLLYLGSHGSMHSNLNSQHFKFL